jgi:hypothetical protein
MVSTPPLLKYTMCTYRYMACVSAICNNKAIANHLKGPVKINDTYNRSIREYKLSD